jgi:hypothetical protein
MRWLALGGVVATAILLAAGIDKPASAAGCARGSVPAVIGGKHTCLRTGQKCKTTLDRLYQRHKLHCVSGRLTRLRPVPLTPVTIAIKPREGSGVTGTATLTPLGASRVKVTLEIANAPPGELPAHIHFDTCRDFSPIRYGLSNVVNGKSETIVITPIAYLRRGHGRFSINVHKPNDPDLTIIACGDIPPA